VPYLWVSRWTVLRGFPSARCGRLVPATAAGTTPGGVRSTHEVEFAPRALGAASESSLELDLGLFVMLASRHYYCSVDDLYGYGDCCWFCGDTEPEWNQIPADTFPVNGGGTGSLSELLAD